MKEKYLISTTHEKNYLENLKKDGFFYHSYLSKKFNYDELNNERYLIKKTKNDLKLKIKCKKLTEKVFEKLYCEISKKCKIPISKKAYSIILIPFLNNFIEIIFDKLFYFDKIIKKNKKITLTLIHKNDFVYFNNFAEFISLSQKDFFNLQIISEIINFNNYTNKKEIIKKGNFLNFIKILNNFLSSLLKNKIYKIDDRTIQSKEKNESIYLYKIDFRHNFFVKKFLKYKSPTKKNLTKNFFNNINLLNEKRDLDLREKVLNKLSSKNKFDQFIFQMVIKYLPSLYFESCNSNIYEINNKIKSFPKFLISNAHGWWTDDKFKFYAATCINNKTKYIDTQHNGTYFIIKNNLHYAISKYFRDFFIGWGKACISDIRNINLPVLYSINKKKINTKSIKSKNDKRIIFMGASINRFFSGYCQSYLNGGNSFSYYFIQYKFLKNLSENIKKQMILRLRHNDRDPRGYFEYLKKNISNLKFEDINVSAASRLSSNKIDIVIVDHCSTPWLEALHANKPLIIFWDKNENLIDKSYTYLFKLLKKYKIFFNCPILASKRLEEISKKNINWWYKDKKIQRLRKEILRLFFFSNSEPVKAWNKNINLIYNEKN